MLSELSAGSKVLPDDMALLEDVAQRRSREAYAELYHRFGPAAYNLALHLTRNPDTAEEAVQEGMLRVWRYAATFEPGNVRGWILRIVARESLKALKSRKRSMSSMDTAPLNDPLDRAALPSVDLEHDEQLTALRRLLAKLPAVDQRLVALYFAAGLSQEEISTELALPQTTVSLRIKRSLESLRAGLMQAGLASALPILGASGMQEALCSGTSIPRSLDAKVLENMARPDVVGLSERLSRRVMAASGARLTFVAAGVLLAGAATMWWSSTEAPLAAASPGHRAEPTPVPAATPVSPEKVYRRWTFEKEPDDLRVLLGSWKRIAGGPTEAASMETPLESLVVVELPMEIPKSPMIIKVKLRMVAFGSFTMNAYWTKGNDPLDFKAFGKRHDFWLKPNQKISDMQVTSTLYIFDRYIVGAYEGEKVYLVRTFNQPYPSNHLSLAIRKWKVEEIEARSANMDEIPASLRNVEKLMVAQKLLAE